MDQDEDGEITILPGSLDLQDERELLEFANSPHNDDTHAEFGVEIHCDVCFARAALDMHYGVKETSS